MKIAVVVEAVRTNDHQNMPRARQLIGNASELIRFLAGLAVFEFTLRTDLLERYYIFFESMFPSDYFKS